MPEVSGEVNFPEVVESLRVVADVMRDLRTIFNNINSSLEYTNELLGKIARK